MEALGAYQAFCDAFGLAFSPPSLGTDREENINFIRDFFNSASRGLDKQITNVTIRNAHDRFLIKFGAGFTYEFSDGDLKRVQTLLNELRELISTSELFDANHKERILRKLEALQMELHKKVSSLDKFWGLIGEGGVALGKFGKDAKPFVDRIKEIAQIVWWTQARAEELPSGTPLTLLSDGMRREEFIKPDTDDS